MSRCPIIDEHTISDDSKCPMTDERTISDESKCPITDEHTISDFRRVQTFDHRWRTIPDFRRIQMPDHRRAHDLRFPTRLCVRCRRGTGSLILYEYNYPISGQHTISDCRRVRNSANLSSIHLCMHPSFFKICGLIALANQV